jgi:hypothetical protein
MERKLRTDLSQPDAWRRMAWWIAKQRGKKCKPDRIYSIAIRGREHLAKWLAIPPQPEIPRNEMLLKLFFGVQVPAQILIVNVERMVDQHHALLEKFQQLERDEIDRNSQYPSAPFWRMGERCGQIGIKAHLQWAEETLAELRKLARKPQRRLPARRTSRPDFAEAFAGCQPGCQPVPQVLQNHREG